MKQKADIRAKFGVWALDGVLWITDHIKTIGIGLGILGIVAVSHRAGYHKAQREMTNGFDKAWCAMLESMIRGEGR